MKTILVVGATGATGRRLTEQLLLRGHHVKAIVRSPEKLPEALRGQIRRHNFRALQSVDGGMLGTLH